MRFLSGVACCLALSACYYPCGEYNLSGNRPFFEPQSAENGYKPESSGKVFHVAGFDVEEGVQMRRFFDDFYEPMHAKYEGNNVIRWTYYIDYDAQKDKGRIVRYCELDNYAPKSLCQLNVEFYRTYVRSATSNCK